MPFAGNLAGSLAGNLAANLAGAGNTASPTDDAIGLWWVDTLESSPQRIANANGTGSTGTSLIAAPRNLFSKTDWWALSSATAADNNDTAPDGTTSASLITGTGNWVLHQTGTADNVPAGTYTIAAYVKRGTGTDQHFCFYSANTASRGPDLTATDTWQRFTRTFTLAAPAAAFTIGIGSIDGVTNATILVCDVEMYTGSSDLGPQSYAGHLYLGTHGFDARPTYSAGTLTMSTSGSAGLMQFGTTQTLTTFTAQALVSKVAAGSAYQSFFSKPQSYDAFSAMMELSTAPFSYLTGAALSPAQSPGLWVALSKGYHVITYRHDGTKASWWLDDVKLFDATKSFTSVAIADMFLNITNVLSLYAGAAYAGGLVLWDRALSDAEVRSAVTVQQARAAASSVSASSAARVLVCEGDSITAQSISYAYKYGPNASPAVHGIVNAVSGSTIASLETRAARVDDILPPSTSGRKFILSVLIGANDLATLGASTWTTNLASYLDDRRAAGWLVAIGTVLPTTNATHNTERATANATIATWVGVHCDAIFDFAADATMGPDAAASDPTYYSDGTHPTTAGQAILETIFRTTINAM